jgi:hypothetical protein
MVAVVASLRLLLRHQYTYVNRNFPMDDPTGVSTFVLLLAGIWLFVFGLVGLIDEKQRKRGNPKT